MTANYKRGKKILRVIGRVVGVLVGLLSIALVAELAVRAWTYAIGGPVAVLASQAREVSSFGFASQNPWQFDPRHGFVGRPGISYLVGTLTDLRGGCAEVDSLWPEKNLGPDWEKAEIRIGLFGAYDATYRPDRNSDPWPALLAHELSRLSGRRVAVANYSRPGVGLVQSLVLAADVAPSQHMQLVVLTPTTATLALDFVYRAMEQIGGASIPVVSSSARLAEEPELGTQIGPIVEPRVTEEWCKRVEETTRLGVTGLLRLDGVVKALSAHANVAKLLATKSLVPDWGSTTPALFNLAEGRSPLFTAVREVQRVGPSTLANPDLGRDPRATGAIDVLRRAGIPIQVLLSPLFPELRDRRLLNYSGTSQEYLDTLMQSIPPLTGHPLLRMFDVLEHDIGGEANKIVVNPPNDWTLRVAGTDLYAKLAARSLLPIVSQLQPHKP